ncbi:hypothetical protein NC651_019219 [Populus alba x Populus x berolinensis]|nr:hypothetical protein NC651_019219 [Populus alba x Populus x berolinensis]
MGKFKYMRFPDGITFLPLPLLSTKWPETSQQLLLQFRMPSRRGRSAAMIIPSKHTQKDPYAVVLKIALSDYVPVASESVSPCIHYYFFVTLTEGRIYTGNIYICGREEEHYHVANKHRNGIEDHDKNGSCSNRSPIRHKRPISIGLMSMAKCRLNQNIHFLELTRWPWLSCKVIFLISNSKG